MMYIFPSRFASDIAFCLFKNLLLRSSFSRLHKYAMAQIYFTARAINQFFKIISLRDNLRYEGCDITARIN